LSNPNKPIYNGCINCSQIINKTKNIKIIFYMWTHFFLSQPLNGDKLVKMNNHFFINLMSKNQFDTIGNKFSIIIKKYEVIWIFKKHNGFPPLSYHIFNNKSLTCT